jgi:hypothetical protein
MADRMLMPPNARTKVSFANVMDNEYKCLKRATSKADHIGLTCALMSWWLEYIADELCPYRQCTMEVKRPRHAGQLKLYISELWHLTEFVASANLVVYAGAAPGVHIKHLATLFPSKTFFLFDPREFDAALKRVSNVFIFTGKDGWFNDEYAQLLSRFDTLFISDIRSGNVDGPEDNFEECVQRDMNMQMQWTRLMRPKAAMFKTRFPYTPGKSVFFKPLSERHLRFGVFATRSGTEMRLVVGENPELMEYDNTAYEERLYYFNRFTRVCKYEPKVSGYTRPHKMMQMIGLDDCWDCRAMRQVCLDYLAKRRGVTAPLGQVVETTELVSALRECKDEGIVRARAAEFHIDCGITEAMLHSFMRDVICASAGALDKLKEFPHCDGSSEQWIDRRHKYDGHVEHCKKQKYIAPAIVTRMREMYKSLAHPPPLLKYAGPLVRKQDR